MKTVIDYLKAYGSYEHDIMGREFELKLINGILILKYDERDWLWTVKEHINPEYLIQKTLEDNGVEIRFCEECGVPYDAGFIAGDGDWYCCQDCFEDAMDKTYGKGKWRASEEEGEYGGWYEAQQEDGTWEDTAIFYTEWY
jgi:hypothetical protein